MLDKATGSLWTYFSSNLYCHQMAVFPGFSQITSESSYSLLTKQWLYIYVLSLNMGNLPRLRGSRIKCLLFEKILPWAEVFIFSSHPFPPPPPQKAIYINSRLKLSFLGSQLAPFLDVQDSKRLELHWWMFQSIVCLKVEPSKKYSNVSLISSILI